MRKLLSNQALLGFGFLMASTGLMDCQPGEPQPVDCSLSLLTLFADTEAATACGIADGKIQLNATGGKLPYTYFINDVEVSSTEMAVAPGIYEVAVKDGQGCKTTLSNLQIEAANLDYQAEITADTQCTGSNGSISIVTGDPFTFSLNGGAFQESGEFSGLETGTYTLEMKQSGGCLVQLRLEVPQGDTQTSWSSTVKPLLVTNCVKSGCHDGVSRNDFSSYAQVKRSASAIYSRVKSGSMPPDQKLTSGEIQNIACWVNEGAREN